MTYRVLPTDEWYRVAEIFAVQNWHQPDPSVAFILIAEDGEGEIKALWVNQLMMHIEPLWVEEGAEVNFRRMTAEMERLVSNNPFFPGVVIYTDNPRVEQMAKLFGMKEVKGKVFMRVFDKVKAVGE